eukprot:7037-Heterococcus_DN1.PRE.1
MAYSYSYTYVALMLVHTLCAKSRPYHCSQLRYHSVSCAVTTAEAIASCCQFISLTLLKLQLQLGISSCWSAAHADRLEGVARGPAIVCYIATVCAPRRCDVINMVVCIDVSCAQIVALFAQVAVEALVKYTRKAISTRTNTRMRIMHSVRCSSACTSVTIR